MLRRRAVGAAEAAEAAELIVMIVHYGTHHELNTLHSAVLCLL